MLLMMLATGLGTACEGTGDTTTATGAATPSATPSNVLCARWP